MIKIEMEPKRLTDMLSKSLIGLKGIESVSALISPTGILFSDISEGVLAVHNQFNRSYFTKYEVDEEREVMFKKELHDAFTDLKFGAEDSLTLEIDDDNNCFVIMAGEQSWKPKLSATGDNRVKFAMAEVPGIGVLPTDPNRPILSQFAIGVSKLATPDVEKLTLRIGEGETLTMELDHLGPFVKKLEMSDTRKMAPGAFTLFIKMLDNILTNFKGDAWITVYDKIVFFTKVEEDYSLMYLESTT